MARYKEYDYSQGKFIPVDFDRQILPGTFEYPLHYLMDNEIDLTVFDLRYQNNETGDPAYDAAILLKIILYAYSRGITSSRKDCAEYYGTSGGLYRPKDFAMSEDRTHCICPAGKRLYRNGGNVVVNGNSTIKFRGRKTDCRACEVRKKCLRNPDTSETRRVYFFQGRQASAPETFTQKMKRRIDSIKGRLVYNRRMGTVEPVFGNICSTPGLDPFTLRGKRKVNTQWLLYCTVHNLLKVHRYGSGVA
ncbi:hypothetical protein BMS3Abin07_01230 [bacterium BMS3Abin07]|nr:hypothetical protein BMS3Abin07_01230 [bacterium BMS3Abin07]GBE33198.1 hypothetical protein BMS3Bbin05_02136 [bacterium BMS3Bbin05]HDL20465.1 hypothetical protein [Nitrospirota bacterium]HDO22316.1 hypothetical protein [Nitrospirota bacterium]HDZ88480.1 hypothetical protein [Nitrospirota bacterium]